MLFVVEEMLEGFKYNIGLGGSGEGVQRRREQRYVHYHKKGILKHFFPSLQFKLNRIR